MDIILEFESKLKIVGWEKVYSARELMKIFWYDKWERFLWAINRAKTELTDDKKIEENFLIVIDKETWWRPKEDVLLTLGACYLVLKKCDNRKENVKILLAYLDDLLKEKKQKNKVNNFNYEKIVWVFIWIFIIFSVWFYFKNYVSFLWFSPQEKFNFYNELEVKNQLKLQEEKIKSMEEKIIFDEIEDITQTINYKEDSFLDKINVYIWKGWNDIFEVNKNINYRNDFTKSLTWVNLIESFFVLWNNWFFRDSCSLLSKKDCLSSSKSNLKIFSNYWEKTKAGYEILDLYPVFWDFSQDKNIYCVKYKYKLRYDTSWKDIIETFNFTTKNINGFEEINSRFCEKIEKWWKNLKCPFKLENYYCN